MGQRKPLGWRGGVNQYADPRAIRPDQLTYAKNAFPTIDGLLHKRESVQSIGYVELLTAGGVAMNGQPLDFHIPDPVTGLDFILHGTHGPATVNGEWLLAVNLNATYQIVGIAFPNPPLVSLGAVSPNTPTPCSYTNYRGRTIVLAARGEGFFQWVKGPAGWKWVRASFAWPAGTVGTAAAQTQSVPVTPRVACSFQGRMVYANFGPGMGHWLVFADLNSTTHTNVEDAPLWALVGPDVLADNGRHLELDQIAGEDIVAMVEVSLGSVTNPLQKALLALTAQNHAILCTGAPVQTSDAQFGDANGYLGDFNAARVNYKCGGVGPGAVCETPYGTFWAGQDDVWCLPSQNPLPLRVGTNIRPVLKACPPALRGQWSMAYADGVLYLALSTANSGSELDPRVQHWRLDLSNGLPQGADDARWFGPQDYEGLPDWLAAGFVPGNQATATLATCIRQRNVGDRETIVGAVMAMSVAGNPRTFFVSLNEDTRAIDVPFDTVTSGITWAPFNAFTSPSYAAGTITRPTAGVNDGCLYVARATGIPGAVEPVWPGVGGTVVDGTVTWDEFTVAAGWRRMINYYAFQAPGHAISMDVKFKDDDWGQPNRAKILRRIDINAYFATRAWSVFRAIMNQGAQVGQLGPIALGGFTLGSGLVGARGELGAMSLGTSALAQEFQSKTYRPKLPAAGRSPEGGTVTGIGDTGIIRARHIQPNFCDLPGLIIDDTNDYISWMFHTGGDPAQVWTVQLTHGYYVNVDTLIATEILAKMNATQGTDGVGVFNIGANPWGYDSAYNAGFPYMNNLKLAFNIRHGAGFVALLFGTAVIAPDASESTTYTPAGTGVPVTVYPGRTERLLAMLGFDTGPAYTQATGLTVDPFDDGRTAYLLGEPIALGASPVKIFANTVVPYQRPAPIQIGALEIEAAVLPGLPFSNKNR